MCTSQSNKPRSPKLGRAVIAVTAAYLAASSGLLFAQTSIDDAIDELLGIMSSDPSVEARKVVELPAHLQGRLMALAEFDDENQQWSAMDGPQDFGSVTVERINVLGYEIGESGFIEAKYREFTDRRVVSYTGLTADRRMSVSLYDDEDDSEHLVLQIRIGPRQLRYLIDRPRLESAQAQ